MSASNLGKQSKRLYMAVLRCIVYGIALAYNLILLLKTGHVSVPKTSSLALIEHCKNDISICCVPYS